MASNARRLRIAARDRRRNALIARKNRILKAKREAANKKFRGVIRQNKFALKSNTVRLNRLGFGKPSEKLTWRDTVKQEYADKARKLNASNVGNHDFWDSLTGGFGAQSRARSFAQKEQAKLQDSIVDYESRAKSALRLKAKKEQRIKWLATNGTQQQYTSELKRAQNWLKQTQHDLQYQQASIEGLAEGWGLASNQPSSGWLASVGKFLDPKKNPISAGMKGIWDYTLGSGDKNIPSIVSAPSRALTALGNLGKKKGDTLYDKSGNSFKSSGNAWQDSWRQANLNAHSKTLSFDAYVKEKYIAQKKLAAEKEAFRNQNSTNLWGKGSAGLENYKAFNPKSKPLVNSDALFDQKEYDGYKTKYRKSLLAEWKKSTSKQNGATAFAAEIALDPMSYLGGLGLLGKGGKVVSAASKGATAVDKWAQAAKGTKFGSKVSKSKLGQGVKWLGKEYKNPRQVLNEQMDAYKKLQAPIQEKFFNKYRTITQKIKDNKFDYTVLDDIGRLSDDEAAILQRMTGINKFTVRDTLRLRGKNNAIKRKLLLDIHKRSQSNARLLRAADNVASTRFVDRYYSKSWVATAKDKKKYDFRAFRKNDYALGAEDLKRAQIERYMMSSADDVGGKVGGEALTTAQKELKMLLSEYDQAKKLGRPDLDKALKKINGKGRYFRKTLGIPMSVWKSSVLALRPAWYVNNASYNAFAGFSAAGAGYARESVKMLKRGALKTARKENPKVIGNFDKYFESKGNPLWKPASGLEDANRLAAYKALKAKGVSDADALKEVNKYFFDYKTKNWERPLKTVMPFWAWTKSTAKLAGRMPFEKPLTAKALHMNDENNQREIEKLPEEMRKYYEGKQYAGKDKDGNPRFMNTPFSPFSSGNFSNVSANPFIAALSEISTQKDYYGNDLDDKSIMGVFADKFPQAKLAKKAYKAWKMSKGDMNTALKYFGEIGSDGFAYTKERQGRDSAKSNYNAKLDPSSGLKDDVLSFLGVPKTSVFNKGKFKQTQKLTELNEKYFATDWEKKYPDYDKRIAAQESLAKKYGFDLQKDLYKGLWAKNDSEFTKEAKVQKEEARNYLAKFWKDYHKQPYGSKSIWVRDKMKQIVDSGVIGTNPFIADGLPDWYDPKARGKADKAEFWRSYFDSNQATRRKLIADNPKYNKFNYSRGTSQKRTDYLAAKSSGDWSAFNAKYGFKSEKQRLYYEAKKSGDWSKFYDYSGDTPEYAANQEKYRERVEAAKFWKKYFASDDKTKEKLMADNPKYNKFKDEAPKTQAEWDTIMLSVKSDRKARAMKNKSFRSFYEQRKLEATADQVEGSRHLARATPKLRWK